MIFEIFGESGSLKYDSLDDSVPLSERFLALAVHKLICGDTEGVKAEDLGVTDEDIEAMMESGGIDEGKMIDILSSINKPLH